MERPAARPEKARASGGRRSSSSPSRRMASWTMSALTAVRAAISTLSSRAISVSPSSTLCESSMRPSFPAVAALSGTVRWTRVARTGAAGSVHVSRGDWQSGCRAEPMSTVRTPGKGSSHDKEHRVAGGTGVSAGMPQIRERPGDEAVDRLRPRGVRGWCRDRAVVGPASSRGSSAPSFSVSSSSPSSPSAARCASPWIRSTPRTRSSWKASGATGRSSTPPATSSWCTGSRTTAARAGSSRSTRRHARLGYARSSSRDDRRGRRRSRGAPAGTGESKGPGRGRHARLPMCVWRSQRPPASTVEFAAPIVDINKEPSCAAALSHDIGAHKELEKSCAASRTSTSSPGC